MASSIQRIQWQSAVGNGAETPLYDPKKVDADLEWITPEKAQHYLDAMGSNRSYSEDTAIKYGRDMTENRWMPTSQGIGFDYTGKLIDGQHRLRAIIKTAVPVYSVVVRNLHPDAMRATDDNRKRTFSDDLKIEDRERYVKVASATSMIVRFQRGRAKNLKLSTVSKIALSRLEQREELARLEREGNLQYSVYRAASLYQAWRIPESAGACVYYLARGYYGEDFTEGFFEALAEGAGLQKGDPTLALAQRVKLMANQKPKAEGHVYAGALLKAMRQETEGKKITLFKIADLANASVRSLFA